MITEPHIAGHQGRIVYCDLHEFNFYDSRDFMESQKMIDRLYQQTHIPPFVRRKAIKEINQAVDEILIEAEDYQAGEAVGIGLLMITGCVCGMLFMTWYLIWGMW